MKVREGVRLVLGIGALGVLSATCTTTGAGTSGAGGMTAPSQSSTGTTSSGSTSTGGGGGAVGSGGGQATSSGTGGAACTTDADCASQSTTCLPATCLKNGTCMGSPAPAKLTCSTEGGKLCDGNGNCVACLSSSDCPLTTTSCILATCSAQGACGTQNEPDHSACSDAGGKVCLGGACVVCIGDTDCSTGNVCQNSTCIGQCDDGREDGTETDVDCGGGSCPPCSTGDTCLQNSDCGSTDACSGNVCTACGADYGQPCGSCGGVYDCSGNCTVPTPANYGNACGSCGGTIECDGATCSIATPANLGASCQGIECSCGYYLTGTIACGGNCVADDVCSCCGSLPC